MPGSPAAKTIICGTNRAVPCSMMSGGSMRAASAIRKGSRLHLPQPWSLPTRWRCHRHSFQKTVRASTMPATEITRIQIDTSVTAGDGKNAGRQKVSKKRGNACGHEGKRRGFQHGKPGHWRVKKVLDENWREDPGMTQTAPPIPKTQSVLATDLVVTPATYHPRLSNWAAKALSARQKSDLGRIFVRR